MISARAIPVATNALYPNGDREKRTAKLIRARACGTCAPVGKSARTVRALDRRSRATQLRRSMLARSPHSSAAAAPRALGGGRLLRLIFLHKRWIAHGGPA